MYDVTAFMEDHPGGDEVLLSATGKTIAFTLAYKMMPVGLNIQPYKTIFVSKYFREGCNK